MQAQTTSTAPDRMAVALARFAAIGLTLSASTFPTRPQSPPSRALRQRIAANKWHTNPAI